MWSLSWIVGVFFGKLRWHERVVLVDEFLRELLEIGLVFFGPPVVELAVAVVLGTLIVEAVADLMADHRSDTAIVRGVFGVGSKNGGCRMAAGNTITFMVGS